MLSNSKFEIKINDNKRDHVAILNLHDKFKLFINRYFVMHINYQTSLIVIQQVTCIKSYDSRPAYLRKNRNRFVASHFIIDN